MSAGAETAFSASTEEVLVHLLLQIVVILLTARISGELARRAGHAPSIGEILGGVALGPSLAGWIVPGPWGWLFAPYGPPLLPYLSHLGLILALLRMGLEFDLRPALEHGRFVLMAAVATLVAPMLAAAGMAPWLWSLAPGEGSRGAYTLFIGLIFAITAIPIMGRVLADTGLIRSRVGVLGVAIAAAKDLATWIVLLVVLGVARPPLDPARVALALGGTVLLGATMLTGGRPVLRWAARRWVDPRGAPSGHFVALVLGLAFLLAAATAKLGVFAIFGAFLAGVTLSEDRAVSEHLADRLHDLTIYLFLPIFFTATGLRTDLTGLQGALWGAVAVVTVASSLASGGVAALLGRWSGLASHEALALGALVNTPGLMVLILLNAGLDAGVIPSSLFAVMMAMAMVRNLMVTPTLRWAKGRGLP